MFKNLQDSFILNNGVKIPCVAYGTYLTPADNTCIEGVKHALKVGYRHIDTAHFYGNEKEVGEGVRQSGLDRKDVFVTSKLWNTDQGYDETLKSFDITLKNLGFDYLDMYLIHWPSPLAYRDIFPKKYIETWKAFEKLYKDGLIRAIGVCNSLPEHLEPLFDAAEIKPMVNQLELHVGYRQEEAVKWSKEHDMVVEAWSPLCKGKVLTNECILEVAEKHMKMPSQILLRWCLQNELLPLPKSVTPSRIEENANLFDFILDDEDMEYLNGLDICPRLGSFPNTANF